MKVLLVEDNMELAGSISNFKIQYDYASGWHTMQIIFEESTGSTMLQKEEANALFPERQH